MSMIAAILAVSLSLTKPADYTYTTPFCSSNQIVGVGMGADGDYAMLRAEDVAFLREAYTERTGPSWVFGADATNAIDVLIPVRPQRLGASAAVFSSADMGSCFGLSYPTNAMPWADSSSGSFVGKNFRLQTSVLLAELAEGAEFPGTWEALRMIADGNVVATNDIPQMWWDKPYIMTQNHICRLYEKLPSFDYAVYMAPSTTLGGGRSDVSNYDSTSLSPEYRRSRTSYKVKDPDTGEEIEIITYYYSGYEGIATNTVSDQVTSAKRWDANVEEYRIVWMRNEYDYIPNAASGPYSTVVLGNYRSDDARSEYSSSSNDYVWVQSPVDERGQDGIEILQTVLFLRLTHTATVQTNWVIPWERRPAETSNIVHRAVMSIPVTDVSLDRERKAGSFYCYKVRVPIGYFVTLAKRAFGSVDDFMPANIPYVHDEEIPGTTDVAGEGGQATARTSASVTIRFRGSEVFMVYRRTHNARTL